MWGEPSNLKKFSLVLTCEASAPAKLNDLMTKILKRFLSSIVDVDLLITTILGEDVEKFFNEIKQVCQRWLWNLLTSIAERR